MKRLLSATAAIALLVAGPLAFADTTVNGANAPGQQAPVTAAPPEMGTSNPAAMPNNGPTANPRVVSGDTSQQSVTPASRTTDSGKQAKEPVKVGAADLDQDQSAAPMPKHHRMHHVAAMGDNSKEQSITAALNTLSANGYSNPQDIQATRGHKVTAKASKDGQDVNVVVDPVSGTVSQQSS